MTKKTKKSGYDLIHLGIIIIYVIAILLLAVAFILPPPGQIDNSILIASGILFAFAGLLVIIYSIKAKVHTQIDYKDVHIEVNDEK